MAGQGAVWLGKATRDPARYPGQFFRVGLGAAGSGKAGHGRAGQGNTSLGTVTQTIFQG
jgi:hypothetical protein